MRKSKKVVMFSFPLPAPSADQDWTADDLAADLFKSADELAAGLRGLLPESCRTGPSTAAVLLAALQGGLKTIDEDLQARRYDRGTVEPGTEGE